jgi:hypothetical protein
VAAVKVSWILAIVVTLHAALLFALAWQPSRPAIVRHAPLQVHLVHLAPSPPPASRVAHVVTSRPQKKKSSATTAPTPKKGKTKQPVPAQNHPSPKVAALAVVRKQIESLGQISTAPAVSPPRSSATSSHPPATRGVDHAQELAKCLQRALKLPDYGSVRVEIALGRDGSVGSVRILEAHSEQNKSYVLATLPTLRLPILPTEEQTYTLTLQNS